MMGYTPAHLNVKKVTGGFAVDPGGVTTDDFYIYPNSIDSYPAIKLEGGSAPGGISMLCAPLRLYYGTDNYLFFELNGGNARIQAPLTNSDVIVLPSGTGRLRFGTHTGSGDVACNGSIDIKDAGGTTRKLMTTA